MKKKTIIAFSFLFVLALGLNLFSRHKNFKASSGPIGDGSIQPNQTQGTYHGEDFAVPKHWDKNSYPRVDELI